MARPRVAPSLPAPSCRRLFQAPSRPRFLSAMTALGVLLIAFTPDAEGWWRYTVSSPPDCSTCHGGFRNGGWYTSLKDGSAWGATLHDGHKAVVSGDCNVCHTAGSYNPVWIGHSTGGAGMEPLGCSGCHGRSRDGWGQGTMGYAYGLRVRHWIADRTVNGVSSRYCYVCHPDSRGEYPAASERDLPPYYAHPGTGHPLIPGDPCNGAVGPESFRGNGLGLDNDGDGLFDAADPDCVAGPATPGEASGETAAPLAVTGYDRATGDISFTYAPACGAAGHNLYFGPLSAVGTWGYSGAECGIGSTGRHTFNPGPGSWFFLVVGTDGAGEGSYGRGKAADNFVHQRPPWVANPCGAVYDISRRCD